MTAAAMASAVSSTYSAEPEFAGSNQTELQLGMASYTFREFGLEETLTMTKRLGLKRIAFKDFHLPLDSTAEQIRATAARVRRDGLELYGCGVVYMKTRAEVDRAFAYAQAAGMSIIIGVPEHALVSYVEQKIKESGIKVAIHNHGPGDEVYPTPQSAYDRIKALDTGFGLCVDVGHTLRAGVDPARNILDLADRVLDVHIKDVTAATGDGRTVEMGRGVVDLPAVCRALRSIRFGGTVAFEFEKDGKDPLPGVAESVGYIRGVLAVI
jgi:sugar phosphate isomerase/epimerase